MFLLNFKLKFWGYKWTHGFQINIMKVYVYSNHIWVDISGSADEQNPWMFVPLEHMNSNLSVNITEHVLLAFKQGHLIQDNSEHSFSYSRACGFHLYKGPSNVIVNVNDFILYNYSLNICNRFFLTYKVNFNMCIWFWRVWMNMALIVKEFGPDSEGIWPWEWRNMVLIVKKYGPVREGIWHW